MMEKLGDLLKKRTTPTGTSKASTDTWLEDEPEELSTVPECTICKGAGFVHPLSDSGKPDFSKVIPCRCVDEQYKLKKTSQLQKYSNLGALSRLTFENLIPGGRENGNRKYAFAESYKAAQAFAKKPAGWLIFVGPNGCGKTHLACAIANYRIAHSQPALYIGVADLLDHLRSAFYPDNNVSSDDLFEKVKNTELLVLDDLTVAVTTAWARGKLEQLLNHRFNARLFTVITTSCSIDELDDNLQGYLTDADFCKVFTIQPLSSQDIKDFEGLELELLKEMTFKNFDYKRPELPLEDRQNLEQAYRLAFNFAQSPKEQGWLILLGQNGCGKTHLAAAIANQLRQSGEAVLFIVVPDLLDHLRSAFSPESRVSYDKLFEKVKKAPVLILDDFGEQSATPWAKEKLYQLINYRYNDKLPTVITSCYALEDIESRISSRMIDPKLSTPWNIVAPDYRGGYRKGSRQQIKPAPKFKPRNTRAEE